MRPNVRCFALPLWFVFACNRPASDPPTLQGSTGHTGSSTADPDDGDDRDDDGRDSSTGRDDDRADSTGEPEIPTAGLFLEGFFPLGVFGQPTEDLAKWAGRGCNAMFEVPQGSDESAWDQQAQRLGLRIIRPPIGSPANDVGRTDLLAWSLPDEPDIEANSGPCGGDCVSLCESLSSQWRKADPERKIFVNLAGPNVLLGSACDFCNGPGDDAPQATCYPDNDTCYPRILATSDWISQDIYPVTGWLPSESIRSDVTVPGQALDRIRSWTEKPLFAIIELSNQRLGFDGTGTRAPTPGEYRAQLWNAIIHGARGVFYFPQAFNPFEFDAAPADVIAELEFQHEFISGIAKVLQGEIDPPTAQAVVGAPLETSWREVGGTVYVIVLNTADNAVGGATIRLGGLDDATVTEVIDEGREIAVDGGVFTDDFDAHGVHVYKIGR